ncbi:tetratricopeptide repeat protein 28-like protein [Lates japonicus]|uniref:Tetratricopeptide repeat protein 28-like protein n=1 Tax=Lates japonicus TaxID=270547 RepID=A0AAD3R2W0_LATJO|nr:tetratricopeptide repeat protein 28-like protein [Lates japonicus]
MKLDKSPFVVVSVIGQELLTAGHHTASVVVLEAALKIGTCSLKLRGSVFSALSSAHWSLGNTEKSTGYMQQDLEVAKTLGDQTGECRAHGNLGSAFFSKGNYREALTNHRNQLVLAMKLKDREGQGLSVFVSTLAEEGIIKESLGYGRVPPPAFMGLMLIEDGRGRDLAPLSLFFSLHCFAD